MAKRKKEKEEIGIRETVEMTTELKKEEPSEEKKETTKRLRYVGKTINHFSYGGTLYQLIPNTVYVNLPDCEAIKRLIKMGELREV